MKTLVLVSRLYGRSGRRRALKVKGSFLLLADARRELARLRVVADRVGSDPDYRILGARQLAALRAEIAAEEQGRRRAGAKKRSASASERRARGEKVHFIRCPTCDAKSRKLFSEMGGLQTRECRNGHRFEVDTFFGFETSKRRVENIDRPISTFPVPYNDYLQGRFKNDPTGKGRKS